MMAAKKTGLRDRLVKSAMTAADTGKKGKGAKAAPDGAVVQITARIPVAMHERLRRHTFDTRESINSMILEGLEAQLKKAGR